MPDADQSRAGGPTRRRVLQAGAGATAFGIAGCSTLTGDSRGPLDAITFLHFETNQNRRTTISELGAAWSAQSDITVNQRDVPEADLPTEITSAAVSNTLPATGELSTRALYSARNAVNTDDATTVIESIGADRFYDTALTFASTGDGGYYGVPLYTWQQLTLYRPTVRDELGLPEPTDWQSFETFASATHDPDNNVYGCLLGSDQSQYTLQCFQPFALANDAHVFDPDGNIVFDDQSMVEALDFYARMCREYNPPGSMGAADVGPVWTNGQTHLYSSNTISFYFEAAAIDSGTVDSIGVVPYVEEERRATYGEVVSTTNFKTGDTDVREAGRSWQTFLRGPHDGTPTNYITWLHMQVGLFNPVIDGLLDSAAYRNHPNIGKWPTHWIDDVIPQAIENMERFGFRDGNVFPEIGQITGQYMITGAIRDIIDGADAQTVASDTADRMRDAITD